MQTYVRDLQKICKRLAPTALVEYKGFVLLPAFIVRTVVALLRTKKGNIHLTDASLAGFVFVQKICSPSSQISLTVHGLDITYKNALYQCYLQLCLSHIDRFVAVSTNTKNLLIQKGIDEHCITVIPCGVWTEESMPSIESDPQITILSVGRLVKRKGIAWAIEHVLPKLRTLHDNIRYVIVGNGPERSTIQRIIHQQGLDDSIEVLGEVSEEQKISLYRTANVLLVPNISVQSNPEGFGIVCIEAASHGLQVLAAAIDALQETVEQREIGKVFESGNAEDCIFILQQMIKSPLTRTGVQGSCMRYYDWEILLESYRAFFFSDRQADLYSYVG